MKIQKLLFPNTDVCDRIAMYYKGIENGLLHWQKKYCVFSKGGKLKTDTYFNSFSIGKWSNYTILDNLKLTLNLSGDFLIFIHHAQKINGKKIDKRVDEKEFHSSEKGFIEIPLSIKNVGIYYFELISLSDDSVFEGGFYSTDIDENLLPTVKIAIGICTFRREKYIENNLYIFNNYLINNEESPLYQNLEIFISDNAKTLPQTLNSNHVRVFPNKNLGGSGGFARAMIEIYKSKASLGITHVLLMDDDICIDPNSIVKTYTLLRLLKPVYKSAFIGGSMLRSDTPHIQSEAADHWDIASHHPVKYNYNLETIDKLIKNEIEDSVNYLSWWYCCMPVDVINADNLPLPLFIKRDDIEYGLRNGKIFITLNGICVWHEPFEYKSSAYLDYYYFRNMCIMNSRHRLSFSDKRLLKELKKFIIEAVMRYRYKEAELALLGVQDYLKGIDWFKQQDGEKLNQALIKMGYEKVPVQDLDFVFIHGQLEKNMKYNESRKKRFFRRISLNGWLLPAKRNIIVPAYKPLKGHFYRAARVLNYEEASGTGFITTKSYGYLLYIIKLYFKTRSLIKKKFNHVTSEYRSRYNELINIEFWNEYLNRNMPEIEIKSGYIERKRPKNTRWQIKELVKSYFIRFISVILFFVPIKKNQILCYVHDRKGFTCNPKYIVKYLKSTYGDQLNIVWVSMYPDSCSEISDMGIPVVEANSLEHIKLFFRSKVCITNDCFPSWALHRKGQIWINTWHGGMNYKHIGYDYLAPMSSCAMKLFQLKNRTPNHFISGSEFFTQDTSASFHYDKKIFLSSGLPRNDVFFEKHPEISNKIRHHYGIDSETKILLYAPTFRRGWKANTYGLDFSLLLNALHQRFGGQWVIFFRNHNFIKSKQSYYQNAIDVSGYDDMQELMYVADILITDYSSCMWDFSLTERPCFIYATDIEYYLTSDRSFTCPIESWGFPIAKTNKELIDNILQFDQMKYQEHLSECLKVFGSYDNGTSSQQIGDLIAEYCL